MKLSRRDLCASAALAASPCRGLKQEAAARSAESVLPPGVKAVWDLDKAYRESTPSRERICVNGLWRWQPAASTADAVPEGGWGYLRVPESWPGGSRRWVGPEVFFPHPSWDKSKLGEVTAAWHQREITVPRQWAGRRIVLQAGYINSYAVVHVDGRKVGEMRYPGGEVDLTSAVRPGGKHVLSILELAMPLKAVMLQFNDTAAARQVAGRVGRRGLCGDVYLTGMPAGPRIEDVKVETSVRRWLITFEAALAALDPQAWYTLRARISDGGRQVAEFSSSPFQARGLAGGRIAFAEHWRPEKLWDTHTPENQYELSLSLAGAAGRTLDTALPVRFGFREFWIDGRDFYLNGTRIYLSAIPLDNGQLGPTSASYDGTRATLQRFKSFGINFVYTHNYGCEPGSHISFEEVLRAADDEGMLVSFSQPHFGHYDWTAPDADHSNGYAKHAEFYVRVAQNHPSVVCYSTSHNSTGYAEDMNPHMIDGIQNPRDAWSLRNAGRALRAEAIIRKFDSSRIVYHHASGNLGSMHLINFYANWAPIQEMSDWFEHWATNGVKPVFTCEYSVPFLWDWSMYRGWYKGKREFGNAVAPWEFCVAEWNAQFLGDSSYRIREEEKANLRWEAEQFRKGRVWQRFDYPYNLNSQVFEERFQVVAMHLNDNFRAFRTWGVSATSPWEYGVYWKPPAYERGHANFDFEPDWERLQRPGPRPVYVREQEARARLAFRRTDWTPTVAAESLYRNNMPLLGYIAGKPAAFSTKDHNYLPGETVEKQIVVINNSRVPVTAEFDWRFATPEPAAGSGKVALAPGTQQRMPVNLKLPEGIKPGRYELRAAIRFSNGEKQEDSFSIDVLAAPKARPAGARIALYDPKGETARMLERMGVKAQRMEAGAGLADFDTLIIGMGALAPDGPGPDVSRVRDGLKVIVFEQTGEVLEKRFGFRIAEYGFRWVFKRVPDHPALRGIGEEHLRNWRGESTILPPRLSYERIKQFNYVPTVKWCGIPVPRLWRNGHRGSVASAVIEKPACGDFLPVLDCGYALQYSPLVEYREGAGMVLFCQMDVNGRTENDPAAEALARNILDYVAAWKPPGGGRRVVYAGEAAGLRHLRRAGFSPAAYEGGALPAGQVLVVGPGGGEKLRASAVAEWLRAGGRLMAIGLDERGANAFLPFKVGMAAAEYIAAHFEPFGMGSPFTGISPAEVHNRDPRTVPLVARGVRTVGNGVLAGSEDSRVVFCQLAPWQFDYSGEKMNVKRTFRRVSCLLARLLGNLGAAGRTPLLARFAGPAGANEQRWLDGLYLDVPEEWDDPYRFFRW